MVADVQEENSSAKPDNNESIVQIVQETTLENQISDLKLDDKESGEMESAQLTVQNDSDTEEVIYEEVEEEEEVEEDDEEIAGIEASSEDETAKVAIIIKREATNKIEEEDESKTPSSPKTTSAIPTSPVTTISQHTQHTVKHETIVINSHNNTQIKIESEQNN